MRFILAALPLIALPACSAPTASPLVSAQYPPSADAWNAPAQTLNSMPPGSANISSAPGATSPSYLTLKFRAL